MVQEGFKRELAVFLKSGVAGCSQLTAENKTAIVRRISGGRVIMASLINCDRNRLMNSQSIYLPTRCSRVFNPIKFAVAVQPINMSAARNGRKTAEINF